MVKFTTLATLGLAIVGTSIATAAPAEARGRARSVSVQGAYGRGYNGYRTIDRDPGSVQANRGLQTNDGRGVTSSRNANWGADSYSGGATRTTNNGTSWGRSTNVTNNGDGTYTATVNHTRRGGSTVSRAGTADRY